MSRYIASMVFALSLAACGEGSTINNTPPSCDVFGYVSKKTASGFVRHDEIECHGGTINQPTSAYYSVYTYSDGVIFYYWANSQLIRVDGPAPACILSSFKAAVPDLMWQSGQCLTRQIR